MKMQIHGGRHRGRLWWVEVHVIVEYTYWKIHADDIDGNKPAETFYCAVLARQMYDGVDSCVIVATEDGRDG